MKTRRVVFAGGTVIIAVLLGTGLTLLPADTDNHAVTVTVADISELVLAGGNITLTINSVTGGTPDSAVNTDCSLSWTCNGASKKITAATDLVSPDYTLTLSATSVIGGTAGSVITLDSTTAGDLVTGITAGTGSCTLQYTASALLTEAIGSVVHTVTLTITSV